MYWPVTNRELINQLTVTRPHPSTIYSGVLLSSRLKNTNLNLVVSLNFIILRKRSYTSGKCVGIFITAFLIGIYTVVIAKSNLQMIQ